MVWDQARAKQLGGGRHPAGGTAGRNRKPPPPAPGETELHRERGGIVLVGFTYNFARCSVCFSCEKAKAGGRNPAAPKTPHPRDSLASTDQGGNRRGVDPQPRDSLASTYQGGNRRGVKEALDAAFKKVHEAKFQSLSVRNQKNRLLSQAKSLAEKIDKQTEVITEAELARGRYRDELAEVYPAVGETTAQMDLLCNS